MKYIIKSVSPKICKKIANNNCTIIISKTAPKEVPFKCYIYCSLGDIGVMTKGNLQYYIGEDIILIRDGNKLLNDKVIGEFMCYKIEKHDNEFFLPNNETDFDKACDFLDKCGDLNLNDIRDYSGGREIYGLCISDLKIYDRPKWLNEFKTPPCEKSEKACGNCKWLDITNLPDGYECECYVEDGRWITRAPKSWQYVQELKE